MSAQSEQSDVEWLLEQLAPPATHDPLWHRYRAIADSIERRDAEIARLKTELDGEMPMPDDYVQLSKLTTYAQQQMLEAQAAIAATRAERDALAALVDEALLGDCTGNWRDRAKALRAPQTGVEK